MTLFMEKVIFITATHILTNFLYSSLRYFMIGGVLTDNEGQVQGLWLTYIIANEKGDMRYLLGLPVTLIMPILEALQRDEVPKMRWLDAEFWTIGMAAARQLGLSDEWVRKVEVSTKSRHTLLHVLSLTAGSPAAQALKEGDVILSMDGNLVKRMSELKVQDTAEKIDMIVLREGKELSLSVPTTPLDGTKKTRIIGWSGAILQQAYRSVLEQVKTIPPGPYISCTMYGSPSDTYNLRSGVWVTEINNVPINDLDDFLREALKVEEQEEQRLQRAPHEREEQKYVRLKTVKRYQCQHNLIPTFTAHGF